MYHGERLNGGTHLVGTALAATGATVLIVLAAQQGDPWKVVSFSVYGVMLLALYSCPRFTTARAAEPKTCSASSITVPSTC